MVRGTGPSSLFRRRENFEWPVLAYVIERPGGHIVIDTGMNAERWSFPLLMRRIGFALFPISPNEQEEIGPQMEAMELRPEDVRTVILTHLDRDHIGGLRWFPNAEVLVHRPEHESALSWMWKIRYQPEKWSSDFEPTLYDMDPEPYGPFPESKTLDADGDLRIVPIPGHSQGQVGVILRTDGIALFFSADHISRQDWFIEDWTKGRRTNGILWGVLWMRHYRKLAAETTRRMHRFIEEVPTVLLPAHDADAPRRLAVTETIGTP
jgi:N-acyl homoserine lactone hydrolase